ncbi:TolC family protein [Fulvivirgaceae bacterium LMO-SS25]
MKIILSNMRVHVLSALLVLISFVGFGQSASFSLQQSLDYALTNNQNLLNAKIERDISETVVKETLSRGLPQITANGGVSKNLIIPQVPFTNPITNEETTIAFQRKYNGNALVNLEQMIFDGSFFVGLEAARTYRQLAEKDQIKTEIDIIEAVTKAYYGVLIAQERLELVDKNFNRLDSLLRETEVLYNNGFAEQIDISRVKVQYNNIRTQRTNLLQFEEMSRYLLQFQMGMPVGTPMELTDNLENLETDLRTTPTAGFNYADRIEYSQLQTNEALAKLDLKNNKVKYIPTVNAFINYGGNMFADNTSDLFRLGTSWIPNSAYGVNISIPIFDGFYKSSLIQRNRLEIKQIENQFALLENNIELELREKRSQLNNSLERLKTEKENMELGMEVFRVTRVKYQEGVGSNLEVIEAETSYKEAETNYYVALYDALIAKVELEKAMGVLKK